MSTEKQVEQGTPAHALTAAAQNAAEVAKDRAEVSDEAAVVTKRATQAAVARAAELVKIRPAPEQKPVPAVPALPDPEPELPPEIKRFYSPAVRGFFSSDLHDLPGKMPNDVVQITHDEWIALFKAQTEGKEITADKNGRPVATDRAQSTAMKRRVIQAQLDALDAKSIRAFREERLQSLGLLTLEKGQPSAAERLQGHEQQAAALRTQLNELLPS